MRERERESKVKEREGERERTKVRMITFLNLSGQSEKFMIYVLKRAVSIEKRDS